MDETHSAPDETEAGVCVCGVGGGREEEEKRGTAGRNEREDREERGRMEMKEEGERKEGGSIEKGGWEQAEEVGAR
ncbi:hypothetical protein NDU88_003076 [Pleurodeles waltl]|uniref:Uncharacterized protein n=1 Tax=Pleurodeles waltl TaxID=8319 RepID=A0AAV7QB67_PLEWA|nr:hypothetical protein NDU88_003076 [Pleurodeles waltl]